MTWTAKMIVFHASGKIYRNRAFHFYYNEVVGSLGCDLRDLIPMFDICSQHAWTRRDNKELAELKALICETYDIDESEFDEWR